MKNYITILAVIAVTFLTSCNIDSKNEYTPQISTSYFLKYKIDATATNPITAKNAGDPDDDVKNADTLAVENYDPTEDAWTLEEITLDGTDPDATEDIYFSLGFNSFTNDLISLKVELEGKDIAELVSYEDDKLNLNKLIGESCTSITADKEKYELKFKPAYNYGVIPVFYRVKSLPDNKDEETFSITITLESDSRYSPATLKLQQTVKQQQP